MSHDGGFFIEKLRSTGVATLAALIYGDPNKDITDFLLTKDESTRTRIYTDCRGKGIYKRSDQDERDIINNLVHARILIRFQVNMKDDIAYRRTRYESVTFYRLNDTVRTLFNGVTGPDTDWLMGFINEFHKAKSYQRNYKYPVDESTELECSISKLLHKFGYRMETTKDYIERQRFNGVKLSEIKIPDVLTRSTKGGISFKDRYMGNSWSESYFTYKNFMKVGSKERYEILKYFIDNNQVALEWAAAEGKNRSLIEDLINNGVVKYYKDHRKELLEYIKRNTELEALS